MDEQRRQRHVRDYLSKDEIRELTEPSDLWGLWAVIANWGLVAASFALVAWRPSALTVVVALVIIGGRHLGLAIMMHDASHRSLFKTRWLNDFVGEWLAAAPTWSHLHAYRKHHLSHHSHAGTQRDPDLGLVSGFPTTRASLARKFLRDLSGLTGIKRVYALLLMDFGLLTYTASTDPQRIDVSDRTWLEFYQTGARNFGPVLITNVLLYKTLEELGHGWLYLLWVGSYLTTFSLFIRIRSMAEHAMTDPGPDDFRNTRTTQANWLARLTVAPLNVNFHLEHHLLMTVPYFRLARMHRLLRERGALDGAHMAQNYREILRRMIQHSSP